MSTVRAKPEARPNEALRAALPGSINQAVARLCAAGERARTPLGEPSSVRRHLRRLLAGETEVPGEPYLSLLCAETGRSAYELFGVQETDAAQRDTFAVASHQFVTTYVGPAAVGAVAAAIDVEPTDVAGVPCASAELSNDTTLYLFQTGAAIFHVVEKTEFTSVAELARWRSRSYTSVLDWASEWLTRASGHRVTAGYVFSVYWLDQPRWDAEHLAAAVKLLSVPKIVLAEVGDDVCGNARAIEERLLQEGIDDDRIVDFSLTGVSVAFASWSAVAYHPLLESRALDPTALVETELLTQSTWSFCRHVLDQVEAGEDPDVDVGATRRYLRAMRSRAMSPRAQESGQSLAMRRAIFATSHLEDQISGVLECL